MTNTKNKTSKHKNRYTKSLKTNTNISYCNSLS